jgi:hypothetical protein
MHDRALPLIVTVCLLTQAAGCRKADPGARPEPQAPPPPAPVQQATVNTPNLEEPRTNTPAPPTPALSEKVRLQMKWPLGRQYAYRMDMDQHSTNRFSGAVQSVQEDLSLGLTYHLSVLEATPDDGRELVLELVAYELEIKKGDRAVVSFDSTAKPTLPAVPEGLAETFRKVVGPKLHLRVDAEGKASGVVGLENWLKAVVGEGKSAAEQMLTQQFNEGFFQQMVDFGRTLPKEAVDVGDAWPNRTEVPAGALGKIAADSTLTLKRWEKSDQQKIAVIEAKGTLKGVPAPGGDGMALEEGTVSGMSWFDYAAGVLIESAVDQTLRLKGEMPASMDDPGGVFTSDIAQRVTVKLVELTEKAP